MDSSDVLNYSLSLLALVWSINSIILMVILGGILMVVREMLEKARDVAHTAYMIENKAKQGVLRVLLQILNFVTERR